MDIEWFKTRKRELGITDADVAETLGVERSVANRVMNGRVAMNFRRAKQMADLFQIPVDELFFRLGVADRQTTGASVKNVDVSADIPVWGKVAAGVWLEQTVVEPDDDCRPSIPYDRMFGDIGHEGLFAVEPEGDSMNMAFMPGTILICERVPFGLANVMAGDYVIVARENHGLHEMTCKRIEIGGDGNFQLWSESSNSRYSEPMVVPKSSDDEYNDISVMIVGIVVRQVRDMRRRA